MKKKILIAEDDSFVIDIYQTKLSQEGYEVVLAGNGQEALDALERDERKPDLILLDIVMPGMDGFTFLKKVKDDPRYSYIPVILLTNLSQKEEIEEGFRLGAKGYLIKSHHTPSEVLNLVKKYIE